jgi:glycosyltransferase involved in cell wall biosynthesis
MFMGNVLFPQGMAGTKRILHAIESLKRFDDITISVLLLRQSYPGRDDKSLRGVYKDIPYLTIGSDIRPDWKLLLSIGRYLYEGWRRLTRFRNGTCHNVLYFYGEPNVENIWFLLYARLIGYKIIFDIVEDSDFDTKSLHILSWLKLKSGQFFSRNICFISDAIIVISHQLHKKFESISRGRFPVFIRPISVDFGHFEQREKDFHSPIRIVYSGSFAEKDGVDNLIAAFEQICQRHDDVVLMLTGKGREDHIGLIIQRIAESPYRSKIQYKGYLNDDAFYRFLCQGDIFCMTRTNTRFAGAGFPFKLGEYLATGKPVVASDVSDIGKYLHDRVNAILIEPGSVEAIVRALDFLISNKSEAGKIGLNGREVAMQYFDFRAQGEALRAIVEKL